MICNEVRLRLAKLLKVKRMSFKERFSHGYQKGFSAGLRDGHLQGYEEQKNCFLASLKTTQAQRLSFQKESLETAFIIAEKILEKELVRDKRTLGNRINQELSRLLLHSVVHIRVHPSEIEPLKVMASGPLFTFEPTLEIAVGCAELLTSHGSIRIEWRSQFAKLCSDIRETFNKVHPEANR